jgi:hypothetical protein
MNEMLDLTTTTAAFTPMNYEVGGRPLVRPQARIQVRRATEPVVFAARSEIEVVDEWERRRSLQSTARTGVEDRLREVLIGAQLASEPFLEASLEDFRTFIYSLPLLQRPAIFLLENGNLRALWRNDHNEQVGLQFLGDELVQYVIFFRRKRKPVILREAGIDLLSEIRTKISATNSEHLLFGGV